MRTHRDSQLTGLLLRDWAAIVPSLARTVATLVLLALAICSHASLTNQRDAAEFHASRLVHERPIVAKGRFVGHCDDAVRDNSFKRAFVKLPFQIDELFSGPLGLDEVRVRVSMDLLAYPGTDVSRYSKRKSEMAELAERRDVVRAEMKRLAMAGRSNGPTFQNLLAQEYANHLEFNALHPTTIAVENRELLWNMGLAIRCEVEYVVAPRMDRSGEYYIGVGHDGSIWWGRNYGPILTALRRLR